MHMEFHLIPSFSLQSYPRVPADLGKILSSYPSFRRVSNQQFPAFIVAKMGCSHSKPESDEIGPSRISISSPQGGLQLIPPPQRDEHGIPITHQQFDLDRIHLQRALGYVAEYLNNWNTHVTIVAVGGAVNTILLRSRETTHDIDFFGPTITAEEFQLLARASLEAAARSSLPLGGDWINNSTTLFIPRALQSKLHEEAITQNEVVFREPGLTILAAPWNYALCAKIERMGSSSRRGYDSLDAATYLHRYIQGHGGLPVPMTSITEWATFFGRQVSLGAIQEVDSEYVNKYARHGVRFEADGGPS